MAVSFIATDRGFELAEDQVPRLILDDLTFTAWGERHRLAADGLVAAAASDALSHDEVGPHVVWSFPCTTRSVRNAVTFQLAARCYDLEPVVALEVLPAFGQPVFGTEECASLRVGALPGCAAAVYVHQRVNEYGRDAVGAWWAQALPLPDPTRGHAWDWGLGTAWRAADGRCGVLLPLRGGGAVARLRGDDPGLSIVASGWCGQHAYPRLPLALVAFDDTPAAALDRAWRAAAGLCEWSFRLRDDKIPVEPFEGLGYATWGGLRRDLDENRVVEAVCDLRDQGVPVRWALLDEGWQQLDSAGRLSSHDADFERFPSGLMAAVQRLQGEAGLRHVGAWLTLQGAWGGLDPDAPLAAGEGSTWSAVDGTTVPAPDQGGLTWWREACRHLRDAGLDFLKIDNQGSARNLYLGRRPLDDALGASLRNVEQAAQEAGLDLLAGMSCQPECYYHHRYTAVCRVSADLAPRDRRAAKLHLAHSVGVGAWLSRLAWPDLDAFPSTHPAARACAVMAALSGGPVYVCDRVGRHDLDLLGRLHLADGRLLLPQVPAEPPASRFFRDPLAPGELLVVAAPAGRVPRRDPPAGLNEERPRPAATLVGLANVTLDGGTVTCDLRLRELGLGAAAYAVATHFGQACWIATPDDPLGLELAELEAEVVTVTPLDAGRAVVGLRDKLLGACGCVWEPDDLISLPEPGLVMLCDETGKWPVSTGGVPYVAVSGDRALSAGEAWRSGPWVLANATSTVFRMLPAAAAPADTDAAP